MANSWRLFRRFSLLLGERIQSEYQNFVGIFLVFIKNFSIPTNFLYLGGISRVFYPALTLLCHNLRVNLMNSGRAKQWLKPLAFKLRPNSF